MIFIKKIKKCPVCDKKNFTSVFDLKSIPLADYYSKTKAKTKHDKLLPIKPVICNNCSHVFLKDYINQNKNYKYNFSYKTEVTSDLKPHFNYELTRIIKDYKIDNKSLCVDIGSNDGTILSIYKKNKMKFVGIEPSIKIAKFANNKGLKTINSFFDSKVVKKIKDKFGNPKIITSTYTFANIENLKAFLHNIKKLISKEGLFIIETGYHPAQMNNKMFDYFYHEHFSYFSLKSLKYLLNRYGFKIIEAKITDPKSGSLLVISKLIGNNLYDKEKSINSIINKEKKIGIYKKIFYKNFFKKIIEQKNKLQKILIKLKKENKKVVGYGASHSSTLLLHQFELDKFLNFIVDDNKIKHFTYSPNHKIPVLPSNYIYKKKIDIVILLAWHKKKYIFNKHKQFTKRNGKFLLPF